MQADAVFMSPPWGGPSYNTLGGSFDVATDVGGLGVDYTALLASADAALHRPVLQPTGPDDSSPVGSNQPTAGAGQVINGSDESGRETLGCIACFLPKSTSLAQLGAALPEGLSCEVERNVLNNRLKSVTVYVGGASKVCEATPLSAYSLSDPE